MLCVFPSNIDHFGVPLIPVGTSIPTTPTANDKVTTEPETEGICKSVWVEPMYCSCMEYKSRSLFLCNTRSSSTVDPLYKDTPLIRTLFRVPARWSCVQNFPRNA